MTVSGLVTALSVWSGVLSLSEPDLNHNSKCGDGRPAPGLAPLCYLSNPDPCHYCRIIITIQCVGMGGLYPAYCLISLYTMRKCEQQDRCVLPLIANLTFRPYIDWNMYQGPDTQMYTYLLSYTLYMDIQRRTTDAVVYFVSFRSKFIPSSELAESWTCPLSIKSSLRVKSDL